MTATGDAYLPPLVTELKADISDLKRGFDAAKRMKDEFVRDMQDLNATFRLTKQVVGATGDEVENFESTVVTATRTAKREAGGMGEAIRGSTDKIKKGFRESTEEIERNGKAVSDYERLVTSRMRLGETAVSAMRMEYQRLTLRAQALREEFNKPLSTRRANLGGELTDTLGDLAKLGKIGADIGITLGDAAGKSFANGMTMLGPIVQTALVTAIIAAAAIAAPAVGAAISAALLLGVGAGVVGLAAYILADDKQIKKAWEKLTKTTSGVFERAASGLKKPFLLALDIIETKFKSLEPNLKKMFDAVSPLVTGLAIAGMDTLAAALPGIVEGLKGAQPVFDALAENAPVFGTAIGDLFKTLGEHGPEIAIFLKDGIYVLSGFIIVLGEVLGKLSEAYVKFRTFAKEVKDGLESAAHAIAVWVTEATVWVQGLFRDLGYAMMDGLGIGIERRAGKTNLKMQTAMNDIYKAAQQAIDAHSPSRKYMQLGQWTMDGYDLGVVSRLSRVQGSLARALSPGAARSDMSAAGYRAAQAVAGQRGASVTMEAAPVVIKLDGRVLYQGLIPYAQRGKILNTSTGYA